jgi:hypothetical protein
MYEEKVKELEAQKVGLSEQIAFAKTMKEREQVLILEREIQADRERLKEMRLESDSVAARNKPVIVELEARVKTLKEESWDSFMDAQELERAIQLKNQDLSRLRRLIKETV